MRRNGRRRISRAQRGPDEGHRARSAIAYVTTRYPSISHTFVLREVQALRARGVAIHTVSIHQASGEHLLSGENREALASTYSIRPLRWRRLLGAHARALAGAPRAYLLTLARSLRMRRPGLRGTLWQLFYFGEAIELWRRCREVGASHVHAHHGCAPADIALLASEFGARAKRGPTSWSMTLHGPDELWNTRWHRLAEKLRHADGVVCISDFARSQAMALVEERHWAKLEIIHCGLVSERYAACDDAARRSPAIESARRPGRILCVGRLVPQKGQAVLIQALGELRAAGCEAELVLVGDGPSAGDLAELTDRLQLGAYVTFAGALGQEEVQRHYSLASVFCSSSFSEGLPVVLMEALASGLPVVTTAIAGVPELIRDGESGLLVAPGRPGPLAAALERVLEDEQLARRLASNGRQRVRDEFDVRTSAARLDRFFARLTQPAQSQQPSAQARPLADVEVSPTTADDLNGEPREALALAREMAEPGRS